MPAAKKGAATERVTIFLTAEQAAWLKSKGNASEAARALVIEAMNLDRLAESVKARSTRQKPEDRSRKAASRKR